MPKSPNSPLIAAYAADRDIPRRTAQDRWKKDHPDVKDWLVRTGARVYAKDGGDSVAAVALVNRIDPPEEKRDSAFASALSPNGGPRPPALNKPTEQRTPEEHAECEAWLMFTANTAAARSSAGLNDPLAAGFARTAMECLKSYQKARAERIRADIEARQMLPIAEYEALLSDVQKIMNVWLSLADDLARVLDPVNPGRVLKQVELWQREKLNPLVHSILGDAA